MRPKHWILLAFAAFFAAFVWTAVSLRNDDSTLSVVVRYVKNTMCWSADTNSVCMLEAMAKYEKKGHYDEAVSTGVELAEKYPNSPTSEWIYEDISALYLRRAKTDDGRAEEYLKQAILYRDKAIPSASDSPYALSRIVALSELIGDLSTVQRCAQYGNSIKLLDRMKLLANEDKDRVTRQLRPDLVEREKVEALLNWIDAASKRVGDKLSVSGCQEERPSAG